MLNILVKGALNYTLLKSTVEQSLMPSYLDTLKRSGGDKKILKTTLAILSRIDKDKFLNIYNEHKDSSPYPGYSKYLDAPTHIARGLCHAKNLGFENKNNLSVLDIGSGPAYFPLICKHYGHQAYALDLPDNPMYAKLKELFEIPWYPEGIYAYKTLPKFQEKYDLITAFQLMFDRKDDGTPWTEKEWEFFLKSISFYIKPRGRLFLGMNTFYPGEEPQLTRNLEYFRAIGGTITGTDVLFTDLSKALPHTLGE